MQPRIEFKYFIRPGPLKRCGGAEGSVRTAVVASSPTVAECRRIDRLLDNMNHEPMLAFESYHKYLSPYVCTACKVGKNSIDYAVEFFH